MKKKIMMIIFCILIFTPNISKAGIMGISALNEARANKKKIDELEKRIVTIEQYLKKMEIEKKQIESNIKKN